MNDWIFVAMKVDVPIKYLNFFLEDDDELAHIKKVLLQIYASSDIIHHCENT